MSPLRRAAYAFLVTASVLLALEAGAWRAEAWLRPMRHIPTPRPGAQTGFMAAAARERDRIPGFPLVQDTATTWGLAPAQTMISGSIVCRINALGLRGPDLGPKAAGEVRVLTVGDSTVFGDGVAESQVFSSVAATELSRRWARTVTGVIGGVPGHDSTQSLARLLEKGAAVEPDWVVIGNLWSDVYKDNGFFREADKEKIRGPLAHLASYRILKHWLEPWLMPRRVRWITSMEEIDDTPDARSRVLLRSYARNLRAMAAEATRIGARPAFLALPAPVDLDPAGAPEQVRAYRAAMAQAADELDAPFIDAPDRFVSAKATIGYFADQVHPNAIGHDLLGRVVADALAAYPPSP